MENLFLANGLRYPSWLAKAVSEAGNSERSGKEARYYIYRTIWSRLLRTGSIQRGETVIYPSELSQTLMDLFPDNNLHKDMGRPTVSLAEISRLV